MRHSQHSATLGALNAELQLPIKNMCGAKIDVRGTFVATLAFEASMNGTDWVAIQVSASGLITTATAPATSAAAPGNFATADLTGFTAFRVRCSAYTSGSAVVTISLTEESQVDQVGIVGTPNVVLGTGSALVGQTYNADNIYWNESVTPQAGGATVTGTSRDAGVAPAAAVRYAAFNAFAFADQAGTLRIEVSTDNVTWRKASADQAVTIGQGLFLSVPVCARYHRAVFVNGATLQTAFMLNTSYTVA